MEAHDESCICGKEESALVFVPSQQVISTCLKDAEYSRANSQDNNFEKLGDVYRHIQSMLKKSDYLHGNLGSVGIYTNPREAFEDVVNLQNSAAHLYLHGAPHFFKHIHYITAFVKTNQVDYVLDLETLFD